MRFCFVYQRRIQRKGLGTGYVHTMSSEQTIEGKGHLGGTPAGLGNYRTRQILYISVLFLWAIALCICRLSLFHNYSIPVLLRVVRQLCYPLVEDAVGACWYVGQPGQGPQPLKENQILEQSCLIIIPDGENGGCIQRQSSCRKLNFFTSKQVLCKYMYSMYVCITVCAHRLARHNPCCDWSKRRSMVKSRFTNHSVQYSFS